MRASVDRQGIRLREVGKSFQREGAPPHQVLNDFSLSVAPGEFVTILGPSGCGKTTLLRLVDGLVAPDVGAISVDGQRPVPGPDIGFVFQSFRLVPWATTADNVGLGLELSGMSRAEREPIVARWLDRVGLSRHGGAYPAQLSGGMKQRVALARALASNPGIILLDEPFASLDAQTREIMQIDLLQLWEERQVTALFVTHSVEEAILLGDRVVVMGAAPQSLREIAVVDLPRPRRDEVRTSARFMQLRTHLTSIIREMIVGDPQSPFFRRG